MALAFELVKLLVSITLLAYSADRLVHSSARLAKALGISATVIGLTLIGYGTSLPEFAVSSVASIDGHAELSVANIVGSNIFNIAVLIGIAAFLAKMTFGAKAIARRDIIALVVSAAILAVLLFFGGIGKIAGGLMVALVAAYTIYAIKHDKETNGLKTDGTISWKKEIAASIVMLALVLLSANLLVTSSVNVARMLGISEWIIGATIIAAGTSMPEFAVTVAAAKRKEMGILLGNIVGSNIFNILWILGFAALLNPLTVSFAKVWTDTGVMLAVTILFALGLAERKITRSAGGVYILIYLFYIAQLIGLVRIF